KATVVKCNVDENGELAQKYGIRGIPTMIFFKNGAAAKTLVGVQPKEEIKKTLEELS
ncbi:MAG: thiol reductase thioredoxin, partial [Bdellovibrio sp. CG_4_9_14_3_um_filter_39_7]